MFFGIGATSSVTQAAGAPGGGVSASPNALVVLVKTKAATPAATASSSRLSVPVTLVSTKSWRLWRRDVRLVQGRGVEHRVHARHAASHEARGRRSSRRASVNGEARHVEADDLAPQALAACGPAPRRGGRRCR